MAEFDATNRAHIRIATKEAKLRETQNSEVLLNIMSTLAGRQWMLEKLVLCHIFATTFAPHANVTAFNEGQRSVGLDLLNDIMQHCPHYYMDMMRERNERDATSDARRERSDQDRGRNNRRSEPVIGDDTSSGNGADSDYTPGPEQD